MDGKRCAPGRGCGQVKGLDEFYKQNSKADGRQSICKACNLRLRKETEKRDKESDERNRKILEKMEGI